MSTTITYLKCLSNLPGANVLIRQPRSFSHIKSSSIQHDNMCSATMTFMSNFGQTLNLQTRPITRLHLPMMGRLLWIHWRKLNATNRLIGVLPWNECNNPANTLRNNNVVITSKRRHFDVITSKWRRFDVITTLVLRPCINSSTPGQMAVIS